MKMIDFSTFKRHGAPKGKSEPLFLFGEVAEKLGVLPGQLRYAMTSGPLPAPKPRVENSGRRKYYAMSDIRPWWAQIGGRDFAVSQRTAH